MSLCLINNTSFYRKSFAVSSGIEMVKVIPGFEQVRRYTSGRPFKAERGKMQYCVMCVCSVCSVTYAV